jgi:hypothetical protein
VRETLFNWLGQDLSGWSCVDVFAGTGILGLESASRGATSVHLFELDRVLCQAIEQHIMRFKAQGLVLNKIDGVQGLSHLFTPAMKAALGVLKASGWMYVESPQKLDPQALMGMGLECTKYLKAGQVHAHLLHRIQ